MARSTESCGADGENLAALDLQQLTHGLHIPPERLTIGLSPALSDYTPPRPRTSSTMTDTRSAASHCGHCGRIRDVAARRSGSTPITGCGTTSAPIREVLAYLAAENAYRERSMAAVKPLEDALYDEIIARLKQDDSTRALSQERLLVQHPLRTRQGTSDICAPQGRRSMRPKKSCSMPTSCASDTTTTSIGAMEVSPDGAVARLLRGHGRPAPIHAALQESAQRRDPRRRHPRCRSRPGVGQ